MAYLQIRTEAPFKGDHRKVDDLYAKFGACPAGHVGGVDAKMRLGNPWLSIWFDAWSLGVEASSVIGLRAVKIAAGGAAAESEARRMVTEKIEASLTLQAKAMNGSLGLTALSAAAQTLEHYRQKVRANQKRLVRRK